MKHFLIVALSMMMLQAYAQTSEDSQTWDVDVSDMSQVLLFNKEGNVKITGTSGDRVKVKVTRKLKAKSNAKLAKAKEEIYLDTMMLGSNLYFYVQNPYTILEIDEVGGRAWYNSRDQGKWRWNSHGDRDVKYEMTIEMQIPRNMPLRAYTHKKDLHITGVTGMLNAGVHHGSLSLKDVKNIQSASGHHGDIDVTFSDNPDVDGKFNTHHGDIKLEFPNTPSAKVSMDSHHGSFYTDFDYSPLALKTSKTKSKRGTTYKVGDGTSVQFGGGAHDIKMHSHHGDMYILRRS